jgi:hypothetical protein
MIQATLMVHVLFGVGCVLSAMWVLVDTLHACETNASRIKWASRATALCMWLALLVGGYWYVIFYHTDKAIILKGPWPFAHNYFMETKEHFVITLLLLASYLPIVASNDLAENKDARRLVLWVAAMVVIVALLAEGHGALIAAGVKVGLLGKPQ